MSVLMHLCDACRHRATSHHGGDRGYSGCPCCRGPGSINPTPVLVQTFDLAGRAQPLFSPGSSWNDGTTHRLRLCDCERCTDEFRRRI